MKKRLLLLLIFAIAKLNAQDVKRIKENEGYGKAVYFVLKSDMKTREGEYTVRSYTLPYRKLVTGTYKNGKREGLWIYFYDNPGHDTKAIGYYEDDKKVDLWRYYNPDGSMVQKYDHDYKVMIKNTECEREDNLFTVLKDSTLTELELDCPPTRIGGLTIFRDELDTEIIKKALFPKDGISPDPVHIYETLSFFITPKGKIEDINLTNESHYPEMFQLIKLWLLEPKQEWIPGILDGKAIKSQLKIPIHIDVRY